jgi:hypothetical protein
MPVLRARADANRRTPTPERANAARTRHWPSHRRTERAAGCATRRKRCQQSDRRPPATTACILLHKNAAADPSASSATPASVSRAGHARGRTQITRSGSARAATLATGSPRQSAARRTRPWPGSVTVCDQLKNEGITVTERPASCQEPSPGGVVCAGIRHQPALSALGRYRRTQ